MYDRGVAAKDAVPDSQGHGPAICGFLDAVERDRKATAEHFRGRLVQLLADLLCILLVLVSVPQDVFDQVIHL